MTTFVLIPGAGGMAWYWHRVVPLLERAGHEVLAVDLPGDDEQAGLHAYADLVVNAIGDRPRVTLVAQSLGGFTAALVATRVRVGRLVFVNAMIPKPGETAGDWGSNTGSAKARLAAAKLHGYSAEFELDTYFFHDVPADVVAEGAKHEREESEISFREPADFSAWPDIPIHVVVGRDDRLFPSEFQTRVARERLDLPVDEVPGGHLVALSHPNELTDQLLAYDKP
jgi:pimeloyl-ACP methyl ester carboxylesterase